MFGETRKAEWRNHSQHRRLRDMTEKRTPVSYLSDSWGMDPPGGTNASGAGDTPGYPAPSIPYNQDSPLNEEWGMLRKGDGGYGHSDEVKDTGTKSSAWNMSREDQAKGFERPGSGGAGEPGTASFEQSIPTTNEWDRGAGSERFAREGEWAGGKGFDGRGHDKPSPGREAMGSSKLVG
jgi:hypothetical protein